MGGNPYATSDLGATVNLLVFWQGQDGQLWRVTEAGGSWASPSDLGSSVAVASVSPANPTAGEIGVTYLESNDHVGESWSNGTTSTSVDLGNGPLGSAPAESSAGNGQVNLFWQDLDDDLVETTCAANATSCPAGTAVVPDM